MSEFVINGSCNPFALCQKDGMEAKFIAGLIFPNVHFNLAAQPEIKLVGFILQGEKKHRHFKHIIDLERQREGRAEYFCHALKFMMNNPRELCDVDPDSRYQVLTRGSDGLVVYEIYREDDKGGNQNFCQITLEASRAELVRAAIVKALCTISQYDPLPRQTSCARPPNLIKRLPGPKGPAKGE